MLIGKDNMSLNMSTINSNNINEQNIHLYNLVNVTLSTDSESDGLSEIYDNDSEECYIDNENMSVYGFTKIRSSDSLDLEEQHILKEPIKLTQDELKEPKQDNFDKLYESKVTKSDDDDVDDDDVLCKSFAHVKIMATEKEFDYVNTYYDKFVKVNAATNTPFKNVFTDAYKNMRMTTYTKKYVTCEGIIQNNTKLIEIDNSFGDIINEVCLNISNASFKDEKVLNMIITVEYGSHKLLSLDVNQLYNIIKLDKYLFNNIQKHLDTTNIISIPLHIVLFNSKWISLHHSYKITIAMHNYEEGCDHNINVTANVCDLSAAEKRKFVYGCDEIWINNYHIEKFIPHKSYSYRLPIYDIIIMNSNKNSVHKELLINTIKTSFDNGSNFNSMFAYDSNGTYFYNNYLHEKLVPFPSPNPKFEPIPMQGCLAPYTTLSLYHDDTSALICCRYGRIIQITENYVELVGIFSSDDLPIKHKLMLSIRQLWNTDNFDKLSHIKTTNYAITNILTVLSPTEKCEGFWYNNDNENSSYPIPVPTNIPVSNNFMGLFEIVIKNLDDQKSYSTSFGSSVCRLSGMKISGCKTYHLKVGDITYHFPEGLGHYYKNFNVQPSKEFSAALRTSLANAHNVKIE